MGNKSRDYYQLKADLIEVRYQDGSTEIVLVFYKTSDPKRSAEELEKLKGFVIVSFKRPSKKKTG